MANIKRGIIIKAPVEKVFTYITNPNNRIEWIPGVTDILNITGKGKGQKWDYTYKMHGIPIKGKVEVLEYIPNKRYAHKNSRGFARTWTYEFGSDSGSTRLDISVEMVPYSIPFLGNMAAKRMLKQGQQQADIAANNIKERLEK